MVEKTEISLVSELCHTCQSHVIIGMPLVSQSCDCSLQGEMQAIRKALPRPLMPLLRPVAVSLRLSHSISDICKLKTFWLSLHGFSGSFWTGSEQHDLNTSLRDPLCCQSTHIIVPSLNSTQLFCPSKLSNRQSTFDRSKSWKKNEDFHLESHQFKIQIMKFPLNPVTLWPESEGFCVRTDVRSTAGNVTETTYLTSSEWLLCPQNLIGPTFPKIFQKYTCRHYKTGLQSTTIEHTNKLPKWYLFKVYNPCIIPYCSLIWARIAPSP